MNSQMIIIESQSKAWESSKSNYGLFFSGDQHPSSRSHQEPTQSYLIRTKYTPITQEITRVMQALCQKPGSKTKGKMFLVLLSLMNLQCFQELCARNRRQRPKHIFFYYLALLNKGNGNFHLSMKKTSFMVLQTYSNKKAFI